MHMDMHFAQPAHFSLSTTIVRPAKPSPRDTAPCGQLRSTGHEEDPSHLVGIIYAFFCIMMKRSIRTVIFLR